LRFRVGSEALMLLPYIVRQQPSPLDWRAIHDRVDFRQARCSRIDHDRQREKSQMSCPTTARGRPPLPPSILAAHPFPLPPIRRAPASGERGSSLAHCGRVRRARLTGQRPSYRRWARLPNKPGSPTPPQRRGRPSSIMLTLSCAAHSRRGFSRQRYRRAVGSRVPAIRRNFARGRSPEGPGT